MSFFRRLAACLLIGALCAFPPTVRALAQTPGAPVLRDGRHDFDFNLGVWHTRITRILDPFAAVKRTMAMSGTVTVRPVWGGRASLEEIEADGPRGHWEGLTLFLYDPQAHQWSQTFIDSSDGTLTTPTIGAFHGSTGKLFAQDTFNGRTILVRGTWSVFTPNTHSYEEDDSDDGGVTWHAAFVAHLNRISGPRPVPTVATARDRQHAFDFDLGTWKTHSTRLLHPLTGSTTWGDVDGITVDRPVWGGRANLAELRASGAGGNVELLSLRWYNPAHQWNIDFATARGGTLGIPGAGVFKHGRADFYDQESFGNRTILVRFSIWPTGPDSAHSEQAFSADGGTTWEVNWRTTYTRMKEAAFTPTRRSRVASR